MAVAAAGAITAASLSGGAGAPHTTLNRQLTPGAVTYATVTQVCSKGYATSVRPTSSQSATLKRQVLARYGIPHANPSAYQMDHLISLELGGDPRSLANLWPEPISEAHRKDRVENLLHDAVCSGGITLAEAQQCEAADWRHCLGGKAAATRSSSDDG